jgi:lysophospholipase L1-like esterase
VLAPQTSHLRRIASLTLTRALAISVTVIGAALAAYHWWPQRPPLHDTNGDGSVVVLCFGDSITAGGTAGSYPLRLRTHLGPLVSVINEGKYGEWTTTGKERLRENLRTHHPDYVVVLEGINDGCERRTQTMFDLGIMAEEIRDAGAVPLIGTVYAPAASNVHKRACYQQLNKLIEAIVKKTPGAAVVDFAKAMNTNTQALTIDGIHPNRAGVQVLAEVAYKALVEASKGAAITHAVVDGREVPPSN